MVRQTADDVEFLFSSLYKSAFSLYKIMICQLTLLTALLDYLTIFYQGILIVMSVYLYTVYN